MPNGWIDAQSDALKRWLTLTKCPMLASLEDGSILWVNQAFEELVEYSIDEITSLKWTDLTFDAKDLAADRRMARMVADGYRMEYQLRKSYRTKSGNPVPVIMHALRYPPVGNMECFLVTALPVDHAADFMVGEMAAVRKLITQMVERMSKGPFERFLEWSKTNPVKATAITIFVAYLLFGERVIDIAERIKEIILHQHANP